TPLYALFYVPSFFFQAEDGIRDFHVTGVQTCALPISGPGRLGQSGYLDPQGLARQHGQTLSVPGDEAAQPHRRHRRARDKSRGRSEERRVGKEGRTRWSAAHEKQNTVIRRSTEGRTRR